MISRRNILLYASAILILINGKAMDAMPSPLPSVTGIKEINFGIAIVNYKEKRLEKLSGHSSSLEVYQELKRLIDGHRLRLLPKEAQGGKPAAADYVFLDCKTQSGEAFTVGVYNRKLVIINGTSYEVVRNHSTDSISPEFHHYLLTHPELWTEKTPSKK